MQTDYQKGAKVFESRGFKEGGAEACEQIKASAAVLWTQIDNIPVPPGNTEAGRLISLAKTELESTVMWAVKALSRQ